MLTRKQILGEESASDSEYVEELKRVRKIHKDPAEPNAFDERCSCGKPATWWCDWKVPQNEHGLCNKPVCSEHAIPVGQMKVIGPCHAGAYSAWKSRQKTREPGEEG